MESEPQRMDELKELVRQNIALTQENNKMLHSMRRSAWVSNAFRLFWIAILIGTSIYTFLYLQPYINQIMGFYSNLQGLQEKAAGFFSQPAQQ